MADREQTFDDCELDAHELWFKQLQELPPDHPIRRRVEEGAAAAHAAMPSVRLPLPHNREEADVTLRHVPMGSQPRIVACNCGAEDDEIHDFGCPLYPSHAPNWPTA